MKKGEVRTALATSMIFVYFTLLSLTFSGELGIVESEVASSAIEHFTIVIGVVIAFYFGSGAVEYWASLKHPSTKN
jgi:hypothetical protein